MKLLPILLALATAGLVGCGQKEAASSTKSTNQTAANGNPLTAPVDYLGAVAQAKKHSVKTIDLVYLNQAIQMFSTEEGRFPKDLNELVAGQYIGRVPDAPYGMKIVYDPARGQVSVVAQTTNAPPARR